MPSYPAPWTRANAELHPQAINLDHVKQPPGLKWRSHAPPCRTPLLALAMALAMALSALHAADPAPPAATRNATEADLFGIYGAGLDTMIAKFGAPTLVIAKRGASKENDRVIFNYDTFLLGVNINKVVSCFILDKWKGPVKGLKIGDTRETVLKVMGPAASTYKDKDGVITAYGYKLKNPDVSFFTNFDATTGLVRRFEINTPD